MSGHGGASPELGRSLYADVGRLPAEVARPLLFAGLDAGMQYHGPDGASAAASPAAAAGRGRPGLLTSAGAPQDVSRGDAIAEHMGQLLREKFVRRALRRHLLGWAAVRGSGGEGGSDADLGSIAHGSPAHSVSPAHSGAAAGRGAAGVRAGGGGGGRGGRGTRPRGGGSGDEESDEERARLARQERRLKAEVGHMDGKHQSRAYMAAEILFLRRGKDLQQEVFTEWIRDHRMDISVKQQEQQRLSYERQMRESQNKLNHRSQSIAMKTAGIMIRMREVELLLMVLSAWRGDTLKEKAEHTQKEIMRQHRNEMIQMESKAKTHDDLTAVIISEKLYQMISQGIFRILLAAWHADALNESRNRSKMEENATFRKEMREFRDVVERRAAETVVRMALTWGRKSGQQSLQRIVALWNLTAQTSIDDRKLRETIAAHQQELRDMKVESGQKKNRGGAWCLRMRRYLDLSRSLAAWRSYVVDTVHDAVSSAQLRYMEQKYEDDTANLVNVQAKRTDDLTRNGMIKSADLDRFRKLQTAFLGWYFAYFLSGAETRRELEQIAHEDEVANLVKVQRERQVKLNRSFVVKYLRWLDQRFCMKYLCAWIHWRHIRFVEASAQMLDASNLLKFESFRERVRRKQDRTVHAISIIVLDRYKMSLLNFCRSMWRETARRTALAKKLRLLEHEHTIAFASFSDRLTKQASHMAANLHKTIDVLGMHLYLGMLLRAWTEVVCNAKAQRLKNKEVNSVRVAAISEALKKNRQEQTKRDSMARSAGNLLASKLQLWKFAMCFRGWREARWRDRYMSATSNYNQTITEMNFKHDHALRKLEDSQYEQKLRLADYATNLKKWCEANELRVGVLYQWHDHIMIPRREAKKMRKELQKENQGQGVDVALRVLDLCKGTEWTMGAKMFFWWALWAYDKKVQVREQKTKDKADETKRLAKEKMSERWIQRTEIFIVNFTKWGDTIEIAAILFAWYRVSQVMFNEDKFRSWQQETTAKYEERWAHEKTVKTNVVAVAGDALGRAFDQKAVQQAIMTWRKETILAATDAGFKERIIWLGKRQEERLKEAQISIRASCLKGIMPFANNVVMRMNWGLVRLYYVAWVCEIFEEWKDKRHKKQTFDFEVDAKKMQEQLDVAHNSFNKLNAAVAGTAGKIMHRRNVMAAQALWFKNWEAVHARGKTEKKVEELMDLKRQEGLSETRIFKDELVKVRTAWRTRTQDWEERARTSLVQAVWERVLRGWKYVMMQSEMREVMRETEELLKEYQQGVNEKEKKKAIVKVKEKPIEDLKARFLHGGQKYILPGEPLNYRVEKFMTLLGRFRTNRLVDGLRAFMSNVPSQDRPHPFWQTRPRDDLQTSRFASEAISLLMTPPPLPEAARAPQPLRQVRAGGSPGATFRDVPSGFSGGGDRWTATEGGDHFAATRGRDQFAATGSTRRALSPGVEETLDVLARTRTALGAVGGDGLGRHAPTTSSTARGAPHAGAPHAGAPHAGAPLGPVSQAELQAQLAEMQQHMAAVRARVAASLRQGSNLTAPSEPGAGHATAAAGAGLRQASPGSGGSSEES